MSGAPDLIPIRPRLLTSWAPAHGLPRPALPAGARRGDPVAGTAVDPYIREDPFATYGRIRERPRSSTAS